MRKLRVGVVVNPSMIPTQGGSYSYYTSLLHGINEYQFDERIEMVNLIFQTGEQHSIVLQKETITIASNPQQKKNQLKKYIPKTLFQQMKELKWLRKFYGKKLEGNRLQTEFLLTEHKIDVLYFLTPEHSSLQFPFITTNWDVGHRTCYAFPEFIENGEYERREDFYRNYINKALLVFCESATGASELKQYYSLSDEKIKVLPIFGNTALKEPISELQQQEILSEYKIRKGRYFVYPAQFWAHKNHYNLVGAFKKLIEQEGKSDIKLILCGSDKGNKEYIEKYIRSLGLEAAILVTGFVADEALQVFYKNAISLVMPTFLGPTNMPLLEAAALQCPVLCSDLKGHREMMGNTAIYFDPKEEESILNALEEIYHIDNREEWIGAALKHVKNSSFNLPNCLEQLNKALQSLIPIRNNWL